MVVVPFHGRIYRNWEELIGLILLSAMLASFALRPLVEWWQRKPHADARARIRKRIEPVLRAYTVKILQYYADNKQLPSNAELQQMQREANEHTPEIWEIIRLRD